MSTVEQVEIPDYFELKETHSIPTRVYERRKTEYVKKEDHTKSKKELRQRKKMDKKKEIKEKEK